LIKTPNNNISRSRRVGGVRAVGSVIRLNTKKAKKFVGGRGERGQTSLGSRGEEGGDTEDTRNC